MDDYKEINKELVKVVQQIKIENGLFKNKILLLQRQLMEEHETRVSREKKFRAMVKNLKTTIMNILEDGGDADLEVPDELPTNSQRRSSLAQIFQEFRQSIIVRRSSNPISPIRSSSRSSSASPSMTVEQQELDAADQQADVEETVVPQHSELLDCIAEFEEESEAQVVVIEDIDLSTSESQTEAPSIVLGRRHRQCRKPLQDVSNLTDTLPTSCKDSAPKKSELNKEVILYSTDYSNDLSLTSSVIGKLSLSQFADVPSSTPNIRQTRDDIKLVSTSSSSSSTRSCSQRRCKPQNLTEPSQKAKLRNEAATIKKSQKSKKKGNYKNKTK